MTFFQSSFKNFFFKPRQLLFILFIMQHSFTVLSLTTKAKYFQQSISALKTLTTKHQNAFKRLINTQGYNSAVADISLIYLDYI